MNRITITNFIVTINIIITIIISIIIISTSVYFLIRVDIMIFIILIAPCTLSALSECLGPMLFLFNVFG